MKFLILSLSLFSAMALAGSGKKNLTFGGDHLSLEGAIEVASNAQAAAKKLNKSITLAVVGSQGETILIFKGDGVGPHNTEASRRKAYTSLSTKTPTLMLLRNVKKNPDTLNLAELPELLLLSGGHPIWKDGVVIGAIGVAGGGSPENDDLIASQAVSITGLSINKK